MALPVGDAKRLLLTVAVAALGAIAAATPVARAATPQWPYVVYRPAGLSKAQPVPLVVLPTTNLPDIRTRSNIQPAADRRGFVVVYAQIMKSYNDTAHANGEDSAHPYPDMVDLSDVIDAVAPSENIDRNRVYMTGFSLGATMTFRAGCVLSSKLTAIAPVSGVIVNPNCRASRPVSLYAFNGTNDPGAPYGGGGGFPSVASEIDLWKSYDGCTGSSSKAAVGPVATVETWSQCRAGTVVQLATIQGGGHNWPTGTFDATTAMTDFFLTLPRATAKPTLAAKVTSVAFKGGKPRSIVIRLSSNAPARVLATLAAHGRTVFSHSYSSGSGSSTLKLRLTTRVTRGTYALTLKVKTSLGSITIRRSVRVSR